MNGRGGTHLPTEEHQIANEGKISVGKWLRRRRLQPAPYLEALPEEYGALSGTNNSGANFFTPIATRSEERRPLHIYPRLGPGSRMKAVEKGIPIIKCVLYSFAGAKECAAIAGSSEEVCERLVVSWAALRNCGTPTERSVVTTVQTHPEIDTTVDDTERRKSSIRGKAKKECPCSSSSTGCFNSEVPRTHHKCSSLFF
ncbi:hypothetical protein K438DRAFT_1935957 [Mycena galopus ATCC 62051]|nr:hypothetical protein K438DRAFT_1935957 [Mycena galopus ATCC 62051]